MLGHCRHKGAWYCLTPPGSSQLPSKSPSSAECRAGMGGCTTPVHPLGWQVNCKKQRYANTNPPCPRRCHIVPLTREGGETAPAPSGPRQVLQVALAGASLAQGLVLSTCLPQLSGPPAGTQTCPSSASQRAACKKTEAGRDRKAVPGSTEQLLSWQGHALEIWLHEKSALQSLNSLLARRAQHPPGTIWLSQGTTFPVATEARRV